MWGLGFGVWGLGFGVWGLGIEDLMLCVGAGALTCDAGCSRARHCLWKRRELVHKNSIEVRGVADARLMQRSGNNFRGGNTHEC